MFQVLHRDAPRNDALALVRTTADCLTRLSNAGNSSFAMETCIAIIVISYFAQLTAAAFDRELVPIAAQRALAVLH